MTKRIPYQGMKRSELKKILKHSFNLNSIAGETYVKMHKSIIQEIQTQKDRNSKAAQKSLHITINTIQSEAINLQPEIQLLVDKLRETAEKNISRSRQPSTVDDEGIDALYQLAISSITIDDQQEPRAEKIFVRGEHAQSRKLYNIRFHLKGALFVLMDWVLLGEVSAEMAPNIIMNLIRSIGELYDLMLIDFEYIHAIILQELYYLPKTKGAVDEQRLIDRILSKYTTHTNLTEANVRKAIDQLVKFHCIDLIDGNVIITESIVIK